MDKIEINIGIFGVISCGKTTFLNAVAGQCLSDVEIKKTTMVPQVYLETEENSTNARIIRRRNRDINESVTRAIDLNNFNIEQCQPIYHNIDRICDLFDPEIIDPQIKINIYDIPGLNDSASKHVYFEWVRKNINVFDIIIFMTDITKGLNNSDEVEILNLLMDSMKRYQMKMICLINKCDDIYYDAELDDLVFEEKEQENIYIQANNILADIGKKYGFGCENDNFTPFLPISSEICFIYRALFKNPTHDLDQIHINRLCKNECGSNQWKKMTTEEKDEMFRKILHDLENSYHNKILDTGYLAVKSVIQKTIVSNKTQFITNHMENNLKQFEMLTISNIGDYVKTIEKYAKRLSQADLSKYHDKLWKTIQTTITNYANSVAKLNTNITKGRGLIKFDDFDTLHSTMQSHCVNFESLAEAIEKIPNYPAEFIAKTKKQIIDKLLNMYQQICSIDNNEDHNNPTNLVRYLHVIKNYATEDFDKYAQKFLERFSFGNGFSYNATCLNHLTELVQFISDNTTNPEIYHPFVSAILLNKQEYMQNKMQDQYLSYLILIKKLTKSTIKKLPSEKYTPYDFLYECTKKNIFTYIGNNLGTPYKQEMNISKIKTVLRGFYDGEVLSLSNLQFEQNLLNAFIKKN